VGEHGQGDVPVPAGPLPDLVVVEAGFALAGLEGLLDRPPGAGNTHQFGQGHPCRSMADVVGQISGVREGPAGQQPVLGTAGRWLR
jgi:hypothetical protein